MVGERRGVYIWSVCVQKCTSLEEPQTLFGCPVPDFGYDLGAKIIISCVRTGLNVCHLDTHCYFSHIIDLVP